MFMRAVGLKGSEKQALASSVFALPRGRREQILVTDRDRVVAELVPPERTRSPVLARRPPL